MLDNLAPGPIPDSRSYTRSPLQGEIKTEVCIIGGGITGIATAYALAKKNIQCVVLEAARVGAGGTGASGGQLLVGTAPDNHELERKYGVETARFLWDLSVEGLTKTRALAQTAGAPCQFKAGNLVVAETDKQANALHARTEYRANRLNYRFEQMISGVDLRNHVDSQRYCAGAFDSNGGHLDPLAFVSNLSQAAERQGAIVFEGTPVLSVDRRNGHLYLKKGSVKAKHIVFSTGPWIGKFDTRLSRYISSVYVYTGCFEPTQAQMIHSAVLPSATAVSDLRRISTFFKLLPTGALYIGGLCSVFPLPEASALSELTSLTTSIFPHAGQWKCVDVRQGVMCVSCDQLPVCGRQGDKVFWAGGYSGHGLTWSIIVADLIAKSLTGDKAGFDQLAALYHCAIEPLAPIRPLFTPLGLAYFRFLDSLNAW
jgi:gamma-glutamylputrescine oxidase